MAGMDIGGIIAGAAGGFGNAIQGMAQEAIRTQDAAFLERERQQALLDRDKAIAEFNADLADKRRIKMASDIDAGAQQEDRDMQVGKLNSFYSRNSPDGAPSNLKYGDFAPEELEMAQLSPQEKQLARRRAAEKRGWITPEQSAQNDYRTAQLDAQNNRLIDRLAMQQSISDARIASAQDIAQQRIDAATERANAPKELHERATSRINSANTSLSQLEKDERQFSRDPATKAEWAQDVMDAREERRQGYAELRQRRADVQAGPAPSTRSPAAGTGLMTSKTTTVKGTAADVNRFLGR